jgi:hypothetical protein
MLGQPAGNADQDQAPFAPSLPASISPLPIVMTTSFRAFLLLFATLSATTVQAQATLEFAPGAGNTTASGPSAASQQVTFQNNATNPSTNTMSAYSPAITTTFALSNQQYALPTSRISSGAGVAFGSGLSTTSGTAPAFALFPLLNAVGGSSNGNYTSTSGVTGGIDVAANSGIEVFTSVEPLPSTVPANTPRYQYADLTLTFSRGAPHRPGRLVLPGHGENRLHHRASPADYRRHPFPAQWLGRAGRQQHPDYEQCGSARRCHRYWGCQRLGARNDLQPGH